MKKLDTNLSTEKIIEEAEKIINQANSKDTSLSIKKEKKKKTVLLVFVFTIIFLILFLSFIFGFITSKSNKIISGVSINGIDVSNLNKNDAIEKLNSQLSPNLSNELTLTRGEYSTKLNLSSIDTKFNFEEAVNTAYNIGRSENNIFFNNAKVISTYFNNQNINLNITYNQDLLINEITNINNNLPDKVVDSSYKIENNNLIISNSSSGYKVQNDILINKISSSILNNITNIELPVEEFEADSIDIESIYNEIHKNAQDAYYSTNPYEIHKEEEGLDFAITLNEAKNLISQEQESYRIPLKILKPKITLKNLPKEAFPDLLATYSTKYSTTNVNRSKNISLSAQSVNGYVLMPGETFSYNDTVGQRTAARGYKEAGVYLNVEVTTGLCGGICQVSSTLYNAVLLSNLEVVSRSNHTFEPTYVPAGQDATVSWGAPDFKFKNNKTYPIKLVATTTNGTVTFNIYGLKTNDDYDVKISSKKVGTIPFSIQYKEDSTLPSGTQKILEKGSNGCKTQTYKILYKNGAEVSRTLISTDTYKPHNQLIAVGTATVNQNPNPYTNTNTNANTDSSVTVTVN